MTDTAAHPEHGVRCPWCQTPAGTRCTTRRGRHLSVPSHDARIDAWTAAQREQAAAPTA